MDWLRNRSLTLVFFALFLVFLVGQVLTGWHEYNHIQHEHGEADVQISAYLRHRPFLGGDLRKLGERVPPDGAFVVLTALLIQKGSPESRVREPSSSSMGPTRFRDRPDVPWPVRRGGWVLGSMNIRWAWRYCCCSCCR